jgi:hypothetical protein
MDKGIVIKYLVKIKIKKLRIREEKASIKLSGKK